MSKSTAEVIQLHKVKQNTKPLSLPPQVASYPKFRYMGSKHRLLPWIYEVLNGIDFASAWDPFSGSGCVAYMMKTMGKRVVASDFLNFPTVIARATVENPGKRLDGKTMARLLRRHRTKHNFIERTFKNIYYTVSDLRFLDRLSCNIRYVDDPHIQSIAMTALIRSCLKKQPRGVFTVTGDLSHYDDGRRDLQLSIEEHFLEQIEAINQACFHNRRANYVARGNVFEVPIPRRIDLVYLDPPYVPRSDDNCYIKRYHFLEGLSCYWQGVEIDYSTKSRKIPKLYTPFSYRSQAVDAFDRMFRRLKNKKIVLSYSSNGYPDLEVLEAVMRRYKRSVDIYKKPHRYHFGTHGAVTRSKTTEYLLFGH